MTKRRGSGEGGIYKRSNGLWCASIELGRDENGNRTRKVVTATTKDAAVAKVKDIRRRLDAGQPVTDSGDTLDAYLDWWLENVMPSTVKPSTLEDYRFILKAYVRPHVGTVPLGKLTPQHVRTMLRQLEIAGRSARTRQYARSVLRRALRHAERDGLVTRNVAALVDGPSDVGGTKLDDALTADQVKAVFEAAKGDRLEALARLLLRLGLRKGEALALRWVDVDLDTAQVAVRGTLKYADGVQVIDTPKTAAADRNVPLTADVRDTLRIHRRGQAAERLAAGRGWIDHDYVFTTTSGTPLAPATIFAWWRTLTERAGIGNHRLHATRHTAATLLLEQGVPLEVVSAILGHASLKITADIYAKVTADSKRRALASLDVMLA